MTVILIAKGQSASGVTANQTTGWKSPWINMGGANALGLFVDVLSTSGSTMTPSLHYQLWSSMDGGASDAKLLGVQQITANLAAGRFSITISTLPFAQIRIEFIVRNGDTGTNTTTATFDATVNTATL